MGLTAGAFTPAGEAEGGEGEESRLAGAGALSQERQPALDSAAGRSWKMIPRPVPPLSSLRPVSCWRPFVQPGLTLWAWSHRAPPGLTFCFRCLEILNI